MKTLLTALASVSLLAAPSLAQAQSRGGHGGGFHGGGNHGVGYSGGGRGYGGYGGYGRGGYHGRGGYGYGYGGYRGYYGYLGGVGLGLALGAAYAYPYWYDSYPGYYGYSSYYGAPLTVIERYDTVYDDRDDSAPPTYGDAPAAQAAAPAACGSWSWDVANDRYNWIPC